MCKLLSKNSLLSVIDKTLDLRYTEYIKIVAFKEDDINVTSRTEKKRTSLSAIS